MPRGRGSTAARASFANGRNLREVGLHQCPSERNGEGVPVRSLRVPSHVPSHPQTAAKVRGFSPIASGFTAETDWLLEEDGFELLVPLSDAAIAKSRGSLRKVSKQLGDRRFDSSSSGGESARNPAAAAKAATRESGRPRWREKEKIEEGATV
jgi:hypothetical protein